MSLIPGDAKFHTLRDIQSNWRNLSYFLFDLNHVNNAEDQSQISEELDIIFKEISFLLHIFMKGL